MTLKLFKYFLGSLRANRTIRSGKFSAGLAVLYAIFGWNAVLYSIYKNKANILTNPEVQKHELIKELSGYESHEHPTVKGLYMLDDASNNIKNQRV